MQYSYKVSDIQGLDTRKVYDQFHAKIGVNPDHQGWFTAPKLKGEIPISDQSYISNVKKNLDRDLPMLRRKPYDDRTFVMVCGGPSLAMTLDLLRARVSDSDYFIVCSNATGKYLNDNGIVADAHFCIDPKPSKALDFDRTHPDTEYWINVGCDPSVFDTLIAQGRTVKVWCSASGIEQEGKDDLTIVAEHQKAKMLTVGGGSMAGLRALTIADALGFRKIEYFGFDGCYIGDKKYAYDKPRDESIVEVETEDGRTFDSSAILSGQANQLLEWMNRMPWMDVTIHGKQFLAAMLECQRRHVAPKVPYLFTKDYRDQQHSLHATGEYGVMGRLHAQVIFMLASQLAAKSKRVDILDYGSGPGALGKAIRDGFPTPTWLDRIIGRGIFCHEYDPMIPSKSAEPDPADIVVCTDVMEHVEPECTANVLDHIQSLTKKLAMFAISTVPAEKTLSDGRNAHINLRQPEKWYRLLKQRFIIAEFQVKPHEVLFVCQSVDAVRKALREKALDHVES